MTASLADDDRTLVVLIDGRRMGTVAVDGARRYSLTYDDAWREARDAIPLSLSMPLARREHGDGPVRAFLTALLPDNERVLERWARTYQVSARNPFALLQHVGEDCAGAAQFVRPARVADIVAGAGEVTWLDRRQVADRLRALRQDPTAWHARGGGQFSLAGAQAKIALHQDPATGRWGDPTGRIPTTHILKPAISGLDDHDLNEHLCLDAGRRLGLTTARTAIGAFGGERAIVVTRYDRYQNRDGHIGRIHQEDLCQAMGVPPTEKYQSDGGPTPEEVIGLLRRFVAPPAVAAAEVDRFVDALAFNWIVGGTDAHAKNYSLLVGVRQVRLAPLYDIASALAYDDLDGPELTMAMKIGGEYGLDAVAGHHWRLMAEANHLDAVHTIARIDSLAERIPGAIAATVREKAVAALNSPLPGRLVERVTARAARCRDLLRR